MGPAPSPAEQVRAVQAPAAVSFGRLHQGHRSHDFQQYSSVSSEQQPPFSHQLTQKTEGFRGVLLLLVFLGCLQLSQIHAGEAGPAWDLNNSTQAVRA